MGEFEALEQVRARVQSRGDRVILPSGDDAAVVRCDGLAVTTVDAFVEGVHFRLATTSMRDLGHRCLAATVSDLAAMGAEPGEAYFAVGLPPQFGERELLELTDGAEALASELGMTICGGDLTGSPELFLAVTAVGHAERDEHLARREGARPGDRVGVTGVLGGSAAGRLLLERKAGGLDPELGEELLERHLCPRPLVDAGRALARSGVTAMLDVSDGIASDAQRLAECSGVLIEIDLPRLPVDEGVDVVARAAGVDPVELAAGGGEDYELLFTAPAEAGQQVAAAALAAGSTVTWIGQVRKGVGVRLLAEGGAARPLHGWDHLAQPGSEPSP
jgi:thiamine-monophosphate kinase